MLPAPSSSKRIIFPAVQNLPCWIYRPSKIQRGDQLIVAVHGISRQYQDQLETYKKLADKNGCWLVVPEFSKEEFPRYQQLAKNNVSPRADLALNIVLISLKGLLNQPHIKMHLCGYSGGAQFAHRYALLYPQNIASLVLCSAGWYTFPDKSVTYPYGLKSMPKWLGKVKEQSVYMLPVLVMVGTEDTGREKSLRKSKKLDQQQGLHRLARAKSWVNAMSQYQKVEGIESVIRFISLAGQGHDFKSNVQGSELLQHIEHFLCEIEEEGVCAV